MRNNEKQWETMRNNEKQVSKITLGYSGVFCINTIYVSYVFSGPQKTEIWMLSGCESLASLPVSTQQRPEFLGRRTKQAVDLDSLSVLSLTNAVSALWPTKQTFLRSHGSRPFNTIEQFDWFITHWKTRPLQGSELAIWEWDAHWRCQHTQVICSLSWENGTLTAVWQHANDANDGNGS